jgi:hypothetical protein
MTYVAEPYEQFVDDLLTALTGGVAREEHRFLREERRYVLSVRDAVPATLRVFGQRNDTFASFEAGRDFRYDAAESALVWEADAPNRPDDRSWFYVNYYRAEAPRLLTDRNPGSVTATLAAAFGRELAVISEQMAAIYRAGFVETATGSALDHIAALLSIVRRDERFAGGEVLFGRSTPAPGEITVPAGTVVSTDRGESFETTADRTLRRGQLSLAVPVRAQVEGAEGQVAPDAIRNVNRPIFGIETVTNEAATFFARSRETDEELRRRIRAALERAGRSTLDGLRYGLIEAIPGLGENAIQVTERGDQPGLVEVRLGLEQKEDAELVRRVEDAILAARPAGVRVTHNLPTRSAVGAGGGAVPRGLAPITHLPADILDASPDVLPLRAQILLRLTEQNLAIAQKEMILLDARDRVVTAIEALPMGGDISHARLLGRVVSDDRVADATLRIGAAHPLGELYSTNLATDGRKARLRADDVALGFMDERVLVDVLVELEPAPGGNGTARAAAGAIQERLAGAASGLLARTTGALRRDELRAELAAALALDAPHSQLRAGAGVVLNVVFEETGRLVSNAAQVAIEPQHVLELRRLSVDMLSPADV